MQIKIPLKPIRFYGSIIAFSFLLMQLYVWWFPVEMRSKIDFIPIGALSGAFTIWLDGRLKK